MCSCYLGKTIGRESYRLFERVSEATELCVVGSTREVSDVKSHALHPLTWPYFQANRPIDDSNARRLHHASLRTRTSCRSHFIHSVKSSLTKSWLWSMLGAAPKLSPLLLLPCPWNVGSSPTIAR